LRGDVPGEEIVGTIDGMLGDTFEDVAQIGVRVEVIEFGSSNEGVDRGSTFAAIA